jgi:cyclopropane fatty-acyl-phospholipid synthase-like methyltransferase
MENRKEHWEKVFATKAPNEVSWTQEIPKTSLEFVRSAGLDKHAAIIDIGGGDSKLVDYLLEEGYDNISVLDISENALEKAKKRLGKKAEKVHWIVSDILAFQPAIHYDFWHDRAAFHFLATREEIARYLSTAQKAINDNGVVTIGTFSDQGPKKCSGLDVRQYTEQILTAEMQNRFEKIKCITEDHVTPFQTRQNFLFCSFKKGHAHQLN